MSTTHLPYSTNSTNSNDFWRRKFDRDYPGDFAPGTILTNPKELYIIKEAFPENFSRFLNTEYRKELYLKLYKLYEMVKNEEYKDEGEEEQYRGQYELDSIIEELGDYIPNNSLTGYVSTRVHRFLYEIIITQEKN